MFSVVVVFLDTFHGIFPFFKVHIFLIILRDVFVTSLEVV